MDSKQVFKHPIEVRFCDLDSLGHINNANYLTYTEQCRTKWLEHSSLCPAQTLHAIPIILARAEIDFLIPGIISDHVYVTTWISHVGHKSFHMEYEIMSEQRGMLAKSKAVLVWYDYQKNTSVPIPQAVRSIMANYMIG